ncbi:MAG: acyl carrier protein [Cyanobacteria bacterium J06639_18]
MEDQANQLARTTENCDSSSESKEISPKNQLSTEEIQVWFISYLTELLDIQPNDVDINSSFESFGLNSSAAVAMTGDLEEWLGYEIEPTIVYDYPTIEALARYLSQED